MGSWAWAVVMMCAGGSREPSAGAMECDIVDNIMCAEADGGGCRGDGADDAGREGSRQR